MIALLLAAAGYSLGAALLARWPRITLDGPARKLVFRGAVGLGALAYLVLGLGLLGRLTPLTGWLLMALAAAAGAPALLAEARQRRRMSDRTAATEVAFARHEQWPHLWPGGAWPAWAGWVIAAVLALLAFWAVRRALLPPQAYDDLSYHLAAPKIYARTGRVSILPWDHHSAFPFTLEMLYTLCLLCGRATDAQLLNSLVGALAVLAVGLLGRDLGGPRVGWLAALIWAATPLVVDQFGTCYTELGFALYQLAAWLAMVEYLNLRVTAISFTGGAFTPKPRQPHWLPLLGLCAGFCVGVKWTGVVAVAYLLGAMLVLGLRDRLAGRALRADLLTVGLIATLVAAPWIARTWLATGNPVFPFAHGVFGSPLWSDDRAAAYDRAQKDFGQRFEVTRDGRMVLLDADPDAHHSLLHLPGALWRLTLHPDWYFDRGASFTGRHRLGPAYLALLPLGLVGWLLLARRRTPPAYDEERDETVEQVYKQEFRRQVDIATTHRITERVSRDTARGAGLLAGHLVFVLLFWFVTMQYSRYLVPHLALWAVLAAWAADGLFRLRLSAVAVGVVLAMQALGGVAFAGLLARSGSSAGEAAWPAMAWLNANAPADARVALYGEPRGYWLDRDYFWAERGHSTIIPDEARRGLEPYLDYLTATLGATHALVSTASFPLDRREGTDDAALVAQAIEAGRVREVYRDPRGVMRVYALR